VADRPLERDSRREVADELGRAHGLMKSLLIE
jgi:hypothetical protein